MANRTRVLIAGAGVGGLALAQALRAGGVDVAVYERDRTPQIRNQGYRIHIDHDGNTALRACLPPEVLDVVRDSSGDANDLVGMYTAQREPVSVQEFPDIPATEITHVDRNAFRRCLLTGLADTVHFGRTVTGYRTTVDGRVRVEFAEGGSDEGDLLVGAEGIGSPVRRQLVPHAVVRDTGLRCLYGRLVLTPETVPLVPTEISRGFCWYGGGTGCGAGIAPMRFRTRQPDGAADYLMTTFVATRERLGVPDETLFALSSRELLGICLDATADWHPTLRALFAASDPEAYFPITIRAAERVDPWPTGPVTLLGDAVHAMPPTGGVGANTALRDAATLSGELLAAVRAGTPLPDAVAAYEKVMLPRGFDTVDGSLRMADAMFA